jgi:alcohol dehydrogenase class IV
MKMVADNLERAIDNPNDKDLRTILSWAATQNGLLLSAIPTGGGSGVHTFALPFAAILGLVHGESLALAIGPLTQYHIQRKPERGRILSDIFGLDTENLEGIELKEKITESLDLWLGRIGLISKLSDYGVKGDMIDQFVQNVSLPRIKNTFGPDFSTEDIRKIYEAC